MKKTLSILLAALLLLSLAACGGAPAATPTQAPAEAPAGASVAETPTEAPATDAPHEMTSETVVTVTIADAGTLAVADELLRLTDADGDGALTLNDALLCAHDEFYAGGAAAGYESESGDYGTCVKKLWGVENGGSYGYFINDLSAMNLDEPVQNGDRLYAYSYADLTAWSDAYAWFEESEETDAGLALRLCCLTYDASWTPVTTSVEGAVLTVDGERTEIVTDAEGRALLPMDGAAHIVSAVSDTLTLTPPALRVG